jgi:hypothetical protein
VSGLFQPQDTTSSLYTHMFLPPVMLIILFIVKELFNFNYQLEEEAGSAEEQPASNKADAYMIVKWS